MKNVAVDDNGDEEQLAPLATPSIPQDSHHYSKQLGGSTFQECPGEMLENQHVAELLRFIFLGTVVETTRLAGQKAVDFAKHCA